MVYALFCNPVTLISTVLEDLEDVLLSFFRNILSVFRDVLERLDRVFVASGDVFNEALVCFVCNVHRFAESACRFVKKLLTWERSLRLIPLQLVEHQTFVLCNVLQQLRLLGFRQGIDVSDVLLRGLRHVLDEVH